jgi:aldehyde dehydrogenase (NAD+)
LKNADELARSNRSTTASPFVAKAVDVAATVGCYRYFAGWADKIHGKTIPIDGDYFCYTRHEPVGVVGQIIPWNFPMLMQAWKLAPALATGNTVVMKPAEQTPLSALRIGELIVEAGFPKAWSTCCPDSVPPPAPPSRAYGCGQGGVHRLHRSRPSDHGSGREIQSEARHAGTGRQEPQHRLRGYRLDEAVEGAHFGLFFNHGQCCCAGSRVFVEEKIYDQFVEKSGAARQECTVGDPFDPKTEQGPQVIRRSSTR